MNETLRSRSNSHISIWVVQNIAVLHTLQSVISQVGVECFTRANYFELLRMNQWLAGSDAENVGICFECQLNIM